MRPWVILSLAFLASAESSEKLKRVTALEAKDHVGESLTVCGVVAGTRYLNSAKGQPTFLNLDKPHPGSPFTVVIWGADRSKFGEPEEKYKGRKICVTGPISKYRDTPQIVVKEPSQIETP